MHKFYHCIILLTLTIIIFIYTQNAFISQIFINQEEIILSYSYNKSIDDFTRCLLYMHDALNNLSIPWFITHGTALNYWRSKHFIAHDIDIGVYYEDLKRINFNENQFLKLMQKKFYFKLYKKYGQLDHGQEWTFKCPQSTISIDIFVFYLFNEIANSTYKYWAASYTGLCDDMLYKKCRWGFPDFNLSIFDIYGKSFSVVSLDFIIERYGQDYMIPKKYDYFQSLTILPNLIKEFRNQTEYINKWDTKLIERFLKFRRK